jgi:hypothetical protein
MQGRHICKDCRVATLIQVTEIPSYLSKLMSDLRTPYLVKTLAEGDAVMGENEMKGASDPFITTGEKHD